MRIRPTKNSAVRRHRPAYLPLFAMMNPTAYSAWQPRPDHKSY
jgi:hypothetical protein